MALYLHSSSGRVQEGKELLCVPWYNNKDYIGVISLSSKILYLSLFDTLEALELRGAFTVLAQCSSALLVVNHREMKCRRPYLLAHFIILQRPQMLCCGNGSESRDICLACLSSNWYFYPFGVMVSGHGIGFGISVAWENGHRIRF